MNIFNYITIVSVALLTVLILVQTRGATLGQGLGGSAEVNTTRRGTDKTIYQLTIIVSFIFAASLLLGIVTT
jgi:preprotein translocase subunit SecG